MTKDERRIAVLQAAAKKVRRVQVDWAASITFSDLAVETGIDRAQISRDFGSKERLILDLIQFLVDPSQSPNYAAHTEEFLLGDRGHDAPLAEVLTRWAAANDELHTRHADLWRAEMLLWAVSEPESPAWREMANFQRRDLDENAAVAQGLLSQAIAAGAMARSEMNAREATAIMRCFIIGALIVRPLAPEQLEGDLSARLVRLLYSAMVGPDEIGPLEQLEDVRVASRYHKEAEDSGKDPLGPED